MRFNSTVIRKFCTNPSLFKNVVQLTKDKFPNLKRGNYAAIDSTDINFFKNILGDNNFVAGEEAKSYNEDWLKSVSGKYLKQLLVILKCIIT